MRVGLLIGRYPEDRYSLHTGYVDALRALDVTPVIVPASSACGESLASELLSRCDGLVVTGGGDVAPPAYRAEPSTELKDVDTTRDAVEIWAVRAFAMTGRPVLGICRGAQVLAVATGGTLVQDLPAAGFAGHWEEERQYESVHGIETEAGSQAAEAAAGAVEVNSIHHQAISDPGPDLRATAWSPDGVIEAAEADGLLAVQWHPERLFTRDRRHLAPFEWLVKRA
jgi:putative glutamine amidotransferase